MRPLIGIASCNKLFGAWAMPNHAASDACVRAVDLVVGGVPLIIPANGTRADIATLVARLDGILLTGSRSNVNPARYGGPLPADGEPVDDRRDGVTLPLARAAVAAGVPLLGICRGLQELNVAMGGTLHGRLRDLPGRLDHAALPPPGGPFSPSIAHEVEAAPGSWVAQATGRLRFGVNSLHGQGIDRLGAGCIADAVAPDGTIEAIHVGGAGFASGVQWHPELGWEGDAASHGILAAFAAAVRAR